MKKIQAGTLAAVIAMSVIFCSCGPNDDKGGGDQKSSGGEGAVDSTKIPNDTTKTSLLYRGFNHTVVEVI